MADPAHVSTILTPYYKPCLPHKEHLLSEWHVFNALFYHCQIQDFYCWILNIVFKALFFLIEDILHINCLISQKLYSAVPMNSLLVMSLTFWCDLTEHGWVGGITAIQATALQCQPWLFEETHLKQNFGAHPQISAVSALWVPQSADISESSQQGQNARGWNVLPALWNLPAGWVIELKESCSWAIHTYIKIKVWSYTFFT